MRKAAWSACAALVALPAIAAPMINAPADEESVKAFEQSDAQEFDPALPAQAYTPDAVVLDYTVDGIHQGCAAV